MEKYTCTIENAKATLEEYGVAIIENVLDDNECENMVQGMWDFLEHITQSWENPIRKSDSSTWCGIYDLYLLHSMLIQQWQIGHAQSVWDIRQNEKCINVFERLWKCDKNDLLVSFDGCSFNIPPEITKRGWNRNNTWYHTDQSYTTSEFRCYQSWVTALDVNEGDATLSFFEKSHKYHEEVSKHFEIVDKKDWYKLSKEEEDFYITTKNCTIQNITCPKGSMVLWDSRTIHCGIEAKKTRSVPNFRCVTYLCYMPRSLSTPKLLLKKQKAFNEMRMTSHYPCNPKLFPKTPRTYGKALPDITQIEKPVLRAIGLKLAGF